MELLWVKPRTVSDLQSQLLSTNRPWHVPLTFPAPRSVPEGAQAGARTNHSKLVTKRVTKQSYGEAKIGNHPLIYYLLGNYSF